MPRVDSNAQQVQQEAKYPEEQQASHKDDRKSQEQERQSGGKQRVDLVEQLRDHFEHTDYSAKTGTPIQRLEHMNADVNKIVAERERIAKEKLIEEEKPFWAAEKAKSAAAHKETHKPIAVGRPKDTKSARDEVAPRISKADRDQDGPTGNLPATTGAGTREMRSTSTQRRSKADDQPEQRITSDNIHLATEKESLDKTLAERKKTWEGFQSLSEDPANHPAGESSMSLTDTLPHEPIRRTGSIAPQPIVDATKAIRPNTDGDAQGTLSSEAQVLGADYENSFPGQSASWWWSSPSVPSQEHPVAKMDTSHPAHLDTMVVEGTADQAFDLSRPMERMMAQTIDSQTQGQADNADKARSWTEGSMKNRLTLPTYLPPNDTPRDSVLAGIQNRLHDAKESIDDKMHSAKESIEDNLHSAKDSIEDKLHDAKESLDSSLSSTKSTLAGWQSDASAKVHDNKERIVDRSNELTATIQRKGDQAKEDWQAKERRLGKRGAELKDDWDKDWAEVKMKGDEIKHDLAAKTREAKDDLAGKATEWKKDIRDQAETIKETASGVLERTEDKAERAIVRVKTSTWWNPLTWWGGGSSPIRERHLKVETNPEGIHLRPESPPVPVRTLSPIQPIQPFQVPLSLRGLEDTEIGVRAPPRTSSVVQKAHDQEHGLASASDIREPSRMARMEDKVERKWNDIKSDAAAGEKEPPTTTMMAHRPTTVEWDILHDPVFEELMVQQME